MRENPDTGTNAPAYFGGPGRSHALGRHADAMCNAMSTHGI